MMLSKEQLDHLQQAARFASGRATGRDPSVTDEATPAGIDERSEQAMVDVIRATEEVARAADDVIRVAHDAAPAAPIGAAEVKAPAANEIFVSAPPPRREIVQLPPFVPRRRSRIPLAVALLALAFGAGATMSWLLFAAGSSRTREQAWNLVSMALESGKARPQLPAAIEPAARRPERAPVAVSPNQGAVNTTPATPSKPAVQPGVVAPSESSDTAHRVAAAESGHPQPPVPPPASVSALGTVPAKVTVPATAGSAGIPSGEPSPAGAAPAPSPGVGVLETGPKAPNPRPAERSLSGIVLGALPAGPTPEKTAPDVPQSPPAPETPAAPSAAPESPTPDGLAACLASRPANLRLPHEETARLLKRGEEFMGEGRVSAARLVFQRAAEACDVRATFALGASYDPIMLQKLGVALLDPDVPAARSWYERAKELGSSEASQELEALSNWHP